MTTTLQSLFEINNATHHRHGSVLRKDQQKDKASTPNSLIGVGDSIRFLQ